VRLAEHFVGELRLHARSQFVRQVSLVAGGTALAQLIAAVFSPVLTRLYGPEAFGILGVFTAMVAIIVPASTLGYGIAVVLPSSDRDARSLVRLALLAAGAASSVLFMALLVFRGDIALLFGFSAASAYLLLLPLVVLFSGCEQTLRQWLIRKQQFRGLSGVAVAQSTATGCAMSGAGLVAGTGPVLLVINAVGHAVHVGLMWLIARPTIRAAGGVLAPPNDPVDMLGLKAVAQAYRDFPFYRAPQGLLNAASQSVAPLMLAALFGPIAAGFYALSNRVLALPIALVSQSVGMVLLPRLAETAQCGESLRPLLLKATLGLAAVGLVPFGVIIVFGPALFGFVFGPEWVIAGDYSRWLAVWLYFGFMNVPCVQAVAVLGLQAHLLIWETLLLVARGGAIAVGALVLGSAGSAIALFAIVGALMNCCLVVWVIRLSRTATRHEAF
jgi:O-antigen/teichoic acid export membrane protein